MDPADRFGQQRGDAEDVVTFGPVALGTESVVITSSIAESADPLPAQSPSTAWETPAKMRLAPRSRCRISAAAHSVPAVSVMSSTRITSRPSTSPITFIASTWVALTRCLATIASAGVEGLGVGSGPS